MKKIKLRFLICCIAMLLVVCPVSCFVVGASGIEDFYFDETESVYAPSEMQDRIYRLIQDNSPKIMESLQKTKRTIVKESITPVYVLDVVEQGRTGEFNIKPHWISNDNTPGNGKGNVYKAKTITEDGNFAGDLVFFIENGVAYKMRESVSEHTLNLAEYDEFNYEATMSYADHAIRIATALGEKEPISVRYVKYLIMSPSGGGYFYINNGKHHVLINQGKVHYNVKTGAEPVSAVVVDIEDDLPGIAEKCLKDYEDYLALKAEWELTRPGETMYVGVGIVSPVMPEPVGYSYLNNINDIAAFLREDEARWVKTENFRKYGIPTIIATASCFVIAAGTVTFAVIKKRRRVHKEQGEPNIA